jgi:ABC-type amino acid transport substrate-binding protein
MQLKTVTFATGDEARKAYESGRCDAYTTDSSGLYGERQKLAVPGDHIVLPEIISRSRSPRRSAMATVSGRTLCAGRISPWLTPRSSA